MTPQPPPTAMSWNENPSSRDLLLLDEVLSLHSLAAEHSWSVPDAEGLRAELERVLQEGHLSPREVWDEFARLWATEPEWRPPLPDWSQVDPERPSEGPESPPASPLQEEGGQVPLFQQEPQGLLPGPPPQEPQGLPESPPSPSSPR